MSAPSPKSSSPMISIAGIRGIVGDSLRLDEFINYAQAFVGGIQPRRLVVGSDTRLSGGMMRHLIFAAAIASGVEVYDLGIVPTPTVGFMVRKLKAGGGVVISASHNPPQWNAFKFFSSGGTFLTPAQFAELLDRAEKKRFRRAAVGELGAVKRVADPAGPHLDALLKTLPAAAIRKRRPRVVLDACNGAGLSLCRALFDALNVRYEIIHAAQEGTFERIPEPLPENLGKLRRAVIKFKADAGFALDPDADRLAIVDETGRAIGEERTIVLSIMAVLDPHFRIRLPKPFASRRKGPVVVNLSTTRAVEDVAARYGVAVERTRIGEAHVVDRMKHAGSLIGGEGNGGVIFPAVHFGRDSATGIGLTLALLSGEGRKSHRKLSELNHSIRDYVILKDKVELKDRAEIARSLGALKRGLGGLRQLCPGENPIADETDGLKIILSDRWVHVRASGTEPIMRLFAEAPTEKDASALLNWAGRALKKG